MRHEHLCRLSAVALLTLYTVMPTLLNADGLTEREEIARRRGTWNPTFDLAVPSGSSLTDAFDIPPALVFGVQVVGATAGIGSFSSLGVIEPTQGDSFVLMSTGTAGTAQAEPGDDFFPEGSANDFVVWTVELHPPEGSNRLSFRFDFLSAEYPDYLGTQFNDTFVAVLVDDAGVQEIARASVNGSAFFPAASTVAAGSGFDLFTEDPWFVDEVFGEGLPDAGLTGFQLVSVPLQQSGSITLQFLVEDRGDGILDSAVILDDLVVSSVETLDPNPDLLEGGKIVDDPERLAVGGTACDQVAADGVTRVLLRSHTAGEGHVEFCIEGAAAPDDGGVAAVADVSHAECVQTEVVDTSVGKFAFAEYVAPPEFNRGGDESAAVRPLVIRSRFTPLSGPVVDGRKPLDIVRPPVVLVHGLWSAADTWTFGLTNDYRFPVTLADYKATNASHFATNLPVPDKYTRAALTAYRNGHIAATQVDIVGHSMGGILSRDHVGTPYYLRSDNFNSGDFHKLLTLNTPHTGSPWANLLQSIRSSLVGGIAETLLAKSGHPIHLGAIEDLATGSEALGAITATPVPSHALVGTGGSDLLALLPGDLGAFYKIVNFFVDTTGLFQGLQHDGVVGRLSQTGGLPDSARTVFGGVSSIHTQVCGAADYSNRVIELLNLPATGSSFAEFPVPSSLGLTANAPAETVVALGNSFELSADSAVTIVQPINGDIVTPGDTIQVQIDATSDITSVLVTGPASAETSSEPPFEINFVIPEQAVGNFEIQAAGTDGSGGFVLSNAVTLYVLPNAELTELKLLPSNPILFGIGESSVLTAVGGFSDGVLRDVSDPSTGTFYQTSDESIVSVSEDGAIMAKGNGVATLIARNGELQHSISARVVIQNARPIANAGSDQTASLFTTVWLDGSDSTDPDNGPESLEFEWLQIAGPQVDLDYANSSAPRFFADAPGTYRFSLVVRDGQADSLPDSVNVHVESTSTSTSTSTTTTTAASTSTTTGAATTTTSVTSTTLPVTTSTTSTTSTTTSTVPAPTCGDGTKQGPEDCDDGDTRWESGQACAADCTLVACGDPDDSGDVKASDALFVLRTAIGAESCSFCICDADGNASVTASDALRLLRAALDLTAELSCGACV